ncbi:igLON family member 5 [Engraulis encrasicolus]|uniref:igLON family member 5 n=1 Tax=Engraulis encrasicolus TaxID=184585 RepID=UPI002FD1344E
MSCLVLRNALACVLLLMLWEGPFAVVAAEYSSLVPDNITVLEGENVTLRCKIDFEATHKAWLYRSVILFAGEDKWTLDPRMTLLTNNDSEYTMTIESITVADEGLYLCSLQAGKKARPSLVYLIVQVPARITNISQDVSVNEGENVNLFCLAEGRPEPTVTWRTSKNGLLSEGEFVDITEIKRHQAEDFECITSNGVLQPDVRRVKVVVNYPPMITDVKSLNSAQPGKTALLRCEAMAVPTATFEWYKDDHRPVESDSTLRIKNEKTRSLLLFTNVTEKHYGNYTCFAINRLGTSNASMLLLSEAPDQFDHQPHPNPDPKNPNP